MRDEWKNSSYDLDKAPCVCAEGPDNTTATHGQMHTYQGVRAKKVAKDGTWTLQEAAETGAAAINMVFKKPKATPEEPPPCDQKCLEAQITAYHESVGVKKADKIVASPSGKTDSKAAEAAWNKYDKLKAANQTQTKVIAR